MTLKEILNYRRAVREYDTSLPIDAEKVRACLEQATLAPTSSNMQLWECYHVTDTAVLERLAKACLSQSSATTARQMVVFVTRQDRYKVHAEAVKADSLADIDRNSPADRKEPRKQLVEKYYGKLMPFVYSRGFKVWGAFRKLLTLCIGMSRPILRQVSEQDVRVTVHKSCALVAQTFMLSMAEAGYDTCPLEGFDSLRVKKILHLPRHTEVNMIVTCGIRTEKGVRGDRFRLPFSEMYHRV